MKRLTLIRHSSNETGVYGVLKYNGTPFVVTAEREDLCNDSGRSCIPAGKYLCKKRLRRSTGKMVFEVMAVPGRSAILLHIGNIPKKASRGCILVGESYNPVGGQQAIQGSADGYREFMQLLANDNEFHLTIKEVV